MPRHVKPIRLNVGSVELIGALSDSPIAASIWQFLPLESWGETWGGEIYFPIRLQVENTEPVERVKLGDIAYWPDGPDLCIFFGPTPKSTDEVPVVASPVTVIGSFQFGEHDFRLIQRHTRGILVRVERREEAQAGKAEETGQ